MGRARRRRRDAEARKRSRSSSSPPSTRAARWAALSKRAEAAGLRGGWALLVSSRQGCALVALLTLLGVVTPAMTVWLTTALGGRHGLGILVTLGVSVLLLMVSVKVHAFFEERLLARLEAEVRAAERRGREPDPPARAEEAPVPVEPARAPVVVEEERKWEGELETATVEGSLTTAVVPTLVRGDDEG